MKLTSDRSQLLAALTATNTALDKKPSHAVLACVVIEVKVHLAQIYSFALSQGCKVTLEVFGEEDGVVCLPSDYLAKVIKKVPEGNVTLTSLPDFMVQIETTAGVLSIQGLDPLEYPELPILPIGRTFEVAASQLKAGLAKCAKSTAKKEYSGGSTAIFVTATDYSIEFFGTDGARAIKYTPEYTRKGSTTGGELKTMISLKVASLLNTILPSDEATVTVILGSGSPSYDFITFGNFEVFFLKQESKNLDYFLIGEKSYFGLVVDKKIAIKTIERLKSSYALIKHAHLDFQGDTFEVSKELMENYKDKVTEEWKEKLIFRMTEFLPLICSEGEINSRVKINIENFLIGLRSCSADTIKVTLKAIPTKNIILTTLETSDTKYITGERQVYKP